MKLNKNRCTLLFVAIIIVGMITGAVFCLLPISNNLKNFCLTLFDNNTKNNSPIRTAKQNNNKHDLNVINQFLQQRYMAMVNRQAAKIPIKDDFDSQEMIDEALHSLHKNPDELERELAVMTLGEYTSDKAKEGILYALNDSEPIVREQAVIQISEWSDLTERQQIILSVLDHGNTDVVIQVLESISEVDDPLLIKRLNDLSKDKNEQIREAAQLALNLVEEN